jgi:hypothetical protein
MTGDTNQGADRDDREPKAPPLTPMQIAGKVVGIALVVLAFLMVVSVMSWM